MIVHMKHYQIRAFSLVCLCLALWTLGCDPETSVERPVERPVQDLTAWPHEKLSAYGFFREPLVNLQPEDGVIPYQVAAPLWADHAGKARFIVLPAGQTIAVHGDEEWLFPLGSVVIKNFYFSKDLRDEENSATPIETRLLIMEADGWTGHTYVWNEELSDATRKIAGRRVSLSYLDKAGQAEEQEYVVPNTNQCKDCHEIQDEMRLLGIVTRQMTRQVIRDGKDQGQISWLAEQGLFGTQAPGPSPSPLVDPFGDADLDERARSYLDANCAHCHRDGGNGGPSGLVLLATETNPTAYGVCKGPVAAGPGSGDRHHDIVPGAPDRSIIIYRMESADPEIKMPEIPNRLPHEAGVELISEWIRGLPSAQCQ